MNNLLHMIPSVLMIVSPILVAAIGGMICEKAGIVNIALEGLMGIGAFTAATVHYFLEASTPLSVWIAILVGGGASLVVSLIHAYASISLNANQTVSGTGINLLATGGTTFLAQVIFKMERTEPFKLGMMPGLGGIYPTAWIALAVVALAWYVLYRRPFGLRLRSCGEHPQAAASAGIDVRKMRYIAVMASGLLAGVAGGCLVLTQTIQYTVNTINGAGFIALAAVSFGRWLPKGVMGASLLFGTAVALSIYMVNIESLRFLPSEFFSVMPYIITLVTLVLFSGKDYAPKAAGQPYERSGS
ncbi:MAG TPA: sugar ABC transporter permease [Spirochaetaceae bacterium]|nr:sugar ABC transporter permease [Spirochaetaceae bacterium]